MEDFYSSDENLSPYQPAKKGKDTKKKKEALHGSSAHNSKAAGRTIEQIYQKKSQLEHVLLRPDTYIGSVEKDTRPLWIFEDEKMVHRDVTFVPGLYKIFDEILVNAADNKQRDPTMDAVRVEIDVEDNFIKVWNNGRGVPVEIHAEEGIYVPEMIFGHLLTSSNYDDSEKKTTGGRNGFGAKLANIFSTEFVIETADGERQKKYKQVFTSNMAQKTEPYITKCRTTENWTCITFKPDLQKFHMDHLERDTVALMHKRVIDIAGCLGKGVKVELNGSRVPIKTFNDYVGLYLSSSTNLNSEGLPPRIYEKVNDRWEVCISLSDGQFQQVSFVNSIATTRGGTHVNNVSDQIVNFLIEKVRKKAGKAAGALIKPAQIRNNLWVFVNSLIVNPAFDSQTKEWLNTRPSDFGSTCILSEDFMKKVLKSGIVESVLTWASFKQDKELKKTDGSKRQRLTGIPKLDDANDAGGRYSQDCTLILTEGDSAKALAVSGLSVVGRDRYGVFPLRGKLLNVRDASSKQIQENAEITNIKQIMGLQHGKEYSDIKSLRYGHIMIMTDQDHDGSHIKGLLINFIHKFWPSLLKVPNFLLEFVTPIVKATGPRNKVLAFYTMPEYEAWKDSIGGNTKGWTIKYYKGLGTSTPKEAKAYFAALDQHRKKFVWSGEADGDHIDLAFSKKKIEARKQWLRGFEPGTFLDQSKALINYTEFVNKELILFSLADNMRSIPSVMDGFKPGQRKILFSCFKRKLKQDVKVAQLAGYVSEHSAYHHGEASLMGTIVGLAQDFVGSNNINVLMPSGQFGTRLQGGKDAASPRYIYTRLSKLTRMLFPEADDCLLDYQNEDGQIIEPTWYAPILPLVLVNGSEGIGTGWSSLVPNYNPRDVIENLKRKIRGEEMKLMIPWYKDFKGTIEHTSSKENGQTFTITGCIEQVSNTVLEITELPVRKWTQDYKEFLEGMLVADKGKEAFIKEMKEHHTDTEVHFELHLTEENMAAAISEGLTKRFKLTTTMSTSNMNLFDKDGRITKYDSPEHIIEEFYSVRLIYYEKRRASLISNLKVEMTKLDNRVRFILAVVRNEIIVSNRKKADLLAELKDKNFTPFYADSKKTQTGILPAPSMSEEEESEMEDDKVKKDKASSGGGGYDYLLGMPLWSLTLEKVQELCNERDEKKGQLEALLGTEPKQLWETDLDNFLQALEVAEEEAEAERTKDAKVRKGAKGGFKGGKGKKGNHSDSEDDFKIEPKKREVKKAPENKKPATSKIPKATTAQANIPKRTLSGTAPIAGGPKKPKSPDLEAKSKVMDSDEEEEGLTLMQKIAARNKSKEKGETDPISSIAESLVKLSMEDNEEELPEKVRTVKEASGTNSRRIPAQQTGFLSKKDTTEAEAPKPKRVTKKKAEKKSVLSDTDEEVDEMDFDFDDSDIEITKPKGRGRGKAAVEKAITAKAPPKGKGRGKTAPKPVEVEQPNELMDSDVEMEKVTLGDPAIVPKINKEKAPRGGRMPKATSSRVIESEESEEDGPPGNKEEAKRPTRTARQAKQIHYIESTDESDKEGNGSEEFFSDQDFDSE